VEVVLKLPLRSCRAWGRGGGLVGSRCLDHRAVPGSVKRVAFLNCYAWPEAPEWCAVRRTCRGRGEEFGAGIQKLPPEGCVENPVMKNTEWCFSLCGNNE